MFDPEEMDLAAEMQAKLHAVTEKMNYYDEQGQLAALKQAYGGELDRESALNLFEEMNSRLGVSMSKAKELYASKYASLMAIRENSTGEARAEAEAALAALEESGYKKMLGEAASGVMGTLTEILTGNIDVSALAGYGGQIRALMEGGLTGSEFTSATNIMQSIGKSYNFGFSSAEKDFLEEWYSMYKTVAPFMNTYANELSESGDLAGAQKIRAMENLYTAMYAMENKNTYTKDGVNVVTAMEEMFGESGIFEELAGIAGDVSYTEGDIKVEYNVEYNVSAANPQELIDKVNEENNGMITWLEKELEKLRKNNARNAIMAGG